MSLPTTAQPATLIKFNSEPGGWIAEGGEWTLTPADGTITAVGSARGVTMSFDGESWWDLFFAPPSGAPLTPGLYEGAMKISPFLPPGTPGLDVSGNGRTCNALTGRFTVLEAEFGGNGDVVRFAADFEMHCEGNDPALYGSVRWASSQPLGPRISVASAKVYEGDAGTSNVGLVVSLSGPAPVPVTVGYGTVDGTAVSGSDYAAVSGTVTFPVGETTATVRVPVIGDTLVEGDETFSLSLRAAAGAPIAFGLCTARILDDDPYKTLAVVSSEQGDPVGQGQVLTLTPADGVITAEYSWTGVHVRLLGSIWWDFYFAPPSGGILAPGLYDDATLWSSTPSGAPGLSVSGMGRGFYSVTGRFQVLEAEYGAGGEVLHFAADFEQHSGGSAAALYGSVRYRSNVPFGPRVSIGSATGWEGDSGSSDLQFKVSLWGPISGPVSVGYQTADETAAAGSDYASASGRVSFAAGPGTLTVPVSVLGEIVDEPDETFTLTLRDPVGAVVAFGPGRGTIRTDDPYKTLIAIHSETGHPLGQGRTFTLYQQDGSLTVTGSGSEAIVVFAGPTDWDIRFYPVSGTPLVPGIYEGVTSSPYSFAPWPAPALGISVDGRGCSPITGRFTVLEAEYNEYGTLVRFAADFEQHCEGRDPALYGSVRYRSAVPLVPRLSAGSVSAYEGDSGQTGLGIPVSLSGPATVPVTVRYQTADGSAVEGSDYTATSGTATFPAGETTVVVPVPVVGDMLEEADETLSLSLHDPVGAPIAFGTAVGTIRNDDPYKSYLYFNSQPGDPIGQGRTFSLTLSDGNIYASRDGAGVRVTFSSASWWDAVFVPPAGKVLTPGVYPGATHGPYPGPATPVLRVYGGGHSCSTLTGRFAILELELGAMGEVLRFAADYEQHCSGAGPALFGSVRYRSAVPRTRRVFVAGASVVEGDVGIRSLDFPAWLSEPSGDPVSFRFATVDGTAFQGLDYASYQGSATIPAGQTDAVIPVPVLGDTLAEADEAFSVALIGSDGASCVPLSSAIGTIVDDDPDPKVAASSVSVTEGNPGSPSSAVVTVELSAASGDVIQVAYATLPGTATLDEDFVYTSGTLTFEPGVTSRTVAVPIRGDFLPESDEMFSLVLFSPVNATLGADPATIRILDDDDGNTPTAFYPVLPCRLVDTRVSGPALEAGEERRVAAAGACGIPPDARAVVLNVTSIAPSAPGFLQAYARGTAPPSTSVLSFDRGRLRAGFAVVRLGVSGEFSLMCGMPDSPNGTVDAVADVSGYFR